MGSEMCIRDSALGAERLSVGVGGIQLVTGIGAHQQPVSGGTGCCWFDARNVNRGNVGVAKQAPTDRDQDKNESEQNQFDEPSAALRSPPSGPWSPLAAGPGSGILVTITVEGQSERVRHKANLHKNSLVKVAPERTGQSQT